MSCMKMSYLFVLFIDTAYVTKITDLLIISLSISHFVCFIMKDVLNLILNFKMIIKVFHSYFPTWIAHKLC